MARGSQHLRKRPVPDAPKPRTRGRRRPNELEEELFFERLRRHAKWAYVLLALVFALTFALLGVGSGNSGLGDLFQGIVGNDTSSDTSKLEEQVRKNPNDAAAFRELATAFQTKNETEEAIGALQRYTALRPKDPDALQELATLYQTRAQELNGKIQEIQAETAIPSRALFLPPTESVFGRLYADSSALGDPIEQAVTTLVGGKTQDLNADLLGALANVVSTYKKVAAADPADAQIQLQLAEAAAQAQDLDTLVAAYKRFLKLAPDDPLAPEIRQRLKQLTAPPAPVTSKG